MAGMNQMTCKTRGANHHGPQATAPEADRLRGGATSAGILKALLGLLLLFAPGCTRLEADWCYQHIRIGQLPRDYRDVLPADASRRTPLGLVYLREGKGRRDAIVVLLADDRRVAGKLHAFRQQRLRGGASRYGLEGRLDPVLCGLAGAGPLDTLRAVVADLADQRGGRLAREAGALVGGGMIRLMRAKAEIAEVGASPQIVDRWLEGIPADGRAVLESAEDGVIRFAYER